MIANGDDSGCRDICSNYVPLIPYCICSLRPSGPAEDLLHVRPTRSGKGTIASVLRALLGDVNVAPMTLSGFGRNFGTVGLLNKPLVLMSDVRFDGLKSGAAEVEWLLNISGQDPVEIDRKYMTPWVRKEVSRDQHLL